MGGISLTTSSTPLELIKESALTVKTETDSKIAELNTILANSLLSPNVREALESLLSILTTLSGDFGTIATTGEATTTASTTTAEIIQGPGRLKREGNEERNVNENELISISRFDLCRNG